jgi:hypothetical protein
MVDTVKSRLVTEVFSFGPVAAPATGFTRVDLEVFGINHFRPSFVALIFVNDPDVTAANASRERSSYAGRFAIFGHETCVGDVGHCEIEAVQRRFDDRPSHPLTRAFKRVVITDAIRNTGPSMPLTFTLVVSATTDQPLDGPLLDVYGMQLTTFG